ncbi:flagellar hook-length control protein FliK [Ghiorsea bivora]|uniref:flagellar hook-length control protein FliK n=1 Tax=Ghiorsea bivora TaxID=1485545 RepID=UPI0005701582|nr:flagellar hook-length control protein FliK [Ghiorsea bivora]
MINTNNISTEASAGTNSISQGKHQGAKTNKTLFSTLLAMLQKGAPQGSAKQTVQQGSHKNTVLSTSEGKTKNQSLTNQQGNKNLQHSLSQTSNIDAKIKHILQQAKNTGSTDKKELSSKNSQHALTQTNITQTANKNRQHSLLQTDETQTVNKNLQYILQQNHDTQTADKNVQYILAQADKTSVTTKGLTNTFTQDTPTNTNNVDASDAIASVQETRVTPLFINTPKSGGAVAEQQTKQTSRVTSQTTTPNISSEQISSAQTTPELLAEASNKKNQASQNITQQHTERFAATMQNASQNKTGEQSLSMQQNKQIEQQITTQQTASQQTNPINTGSEQANDGIKTSQAAIAAVQQRTSSQTQQTQSTNTNTVAATSPNAISMAAADNNAASQQDLNSNQRDADMSLLDATKTDNKNAKGLDFQAQLAYKSQRTFTPADTMLEIVKSAKTGNTSLELQLEPANLGKVQVSIQIDQAKHIQVVFTVDQAASKQALEQQMPQLRLAMAQQGLDLGSFSMQMNQQGGQQQGGNQQASNTSTTGNALDATILTHSNDEQNTRIGVNLAAQGHLSILA